MWGENYYHQEPIGLHDVILTATPEKMNIIKEKYYYPNNSMLVVAGDVDHNNVFPMVKRSTAAGSRVILIPSRNG